MSFFRSNFFRSFGGTKALALLSLSNLIGTFLWPLSYSLLVVSDKGLFDSPEQRSLNQIWASVKISFWIVGGVFSLGIFLTSVVLLFSPHQKIEGMLNNSWSGVVLTLLLAVYAVCGAALWMI